MIGVEWRRFRLIGTIVSVGPDGLSAPASSPLLSELIEPPLATASYIRQILGVYDHGNRS
jgi:hypothetical protein